MSDVSLSLFVDFALARGGSMATVAKSHHRAAYDYYEVLKLGIVKVLSGGAPFASLQAYVEGERARDARRGSILSDRVEALRLFMKRHKLGDEAARKTAWIEPPTGIMPLAFGMKVAVNPEIALVLKGTPHVLKLYLRSGGAEKLSKPRIEMTSGILASTLRDVAPAGAVFGMLDLTDGAVHLVKGAATLERCALVARALGLAYPPLFKEAA